MHTFEWCSPPDIENVRIENLQRSILRMPYPGRVVHDGGVVVGTGLHDGALRPVKLVQVGIHIIPYNPHEIISIQPVMRKTQRRDSRVFPELYKSDEIFGHICKRKYR